MSRNKHGHFSWVDLSATDVEKQSAFYEELFGWTHEDVPTPGGGPPYRMLHKDGKLVSGMGPMPPDMADMPSMWNAYVTVDDAEATIAKAESLGGSVMMPLMDVEGFGRMVGVADPTGGPLFFWQPMGHTGAELFGVHGSVIWNDLNTRDMTAAADYYEALFDWTVDRSGDNDENYWGFQVDGDSEGGIMRMGEEFPPHVPSHWLTYFAVDDAHAAVEKAKAHGGRAEMEPMEIPVCIFCVLSDPEGAVFAVMQMKPR
jgi:predicted enzyme related to lactoylglutathione lyase